MPLGSVGVVKVLKQDLCWNHREVEFDKLEGPKEILFIECGTIKVNAAMEIWANIVPLDHSLEPYRQLMQSERLTYYCLNHPGQVSLELEVGDYLPAQQTYLVDPTKPETTSITIEFTHVKFSG